MEKTVSFGRHSSATIRSSIPVSVIRLAVQMLICSKGFSQFNIQSSSSVVMLLVNLRARHSRASMPSSIQHPKMVFNQLT